VDLRIEIVQRLLESSRQYTLSLLEGLSDDDWFWTPDRGLGDGVSATDPAAEPTDAVYGSHIAWQVGHIAMAEYGLLLFRQRGRAEVDLELMPGSFRKRFAKGSQPSPDRTAYPEPSEILSQLEKIRTQVLLELPGYDPASLDDPLDPPTAGYATKYGAMLMAPQHEMLHCGQIGVLRRMLGRAPIR
jgi:hypothetical protein